MLGKKKREEASAGKPEKEIPLWLQVLKCALRFLGRAVVTVLSVFIISGCIIGCVLAAVVLGMVNDTQDIDLSALELSYTTIIYTKDPETGSFVEDTKLYGDNGKLIWANYDEMPKCLIDAVVAAEDKRFWQHQGVDFTRTLSAASST